MHPAALFLDFLLIGIQSFGGGSSTFSLIHQVSLKRNWLDESEFLRAWSLVQISPGINLIKLTVMIGYKVAGWPGILAAVGGLLLPSAGVTVLMTVEYTSIRELSWVQAVMKGIIPAVIGLSFAMGLQMAQPVFMNARKDGLLRIGAHLAVLLFAALLMGFSHVSPIFILLLSGIVTVALFKLIPARKADDGNRDQQ